jgi:hypothetical protein
MKSLFIHKEIDLFPLGVMYCFLLREDFSIDKAYLEKINIGGRPKYNYHYLREFQTGGASNGCLSIYVVIKTKSCCHYFALLRPTYNGRGR